MTDDLVKRLREVGDRNGLMYADYDTTVEAASRIEKLEAALLVALGMLSEMGLSYAEKCEMAYEHLLKIKVAALVEEKKDE